MPTAEGLPAGVERGGEATTGERYNPIAENPFVPVAKEPLSTFSIDVDTASYANMRRFLTQEALPPRDSVRIEEFVNYFPYAYPQPTGDDPFSINVEVARCPWEPAHRLARIGLKGREIAADKRPPSNLVFLIDVSGSMAAPNKLPLVKAGAAAPDRPAGRGRPRRHRRLCGAFRHAPALDLLRPQGRRSSRPSTSSPGGRLDQRRRRASSSPTTSPRPTSSRGARTASSSAPTATSTSASPSQEDLVKLIEQKAKRKVFLSVLGFGMGNLKDGIMEQLADKGNGNYAYIDSMLEARKVLVEQLSGTLVTIAKDVKIQVEFNPARVASYRLIGYENRVLRKQDFNDDTKDAGEIGAGHTVTALYELVPADGGDCAGCLGR